MSAPTDDQRITAAMEGAALYAKTPAAIMGKATRRGLSVR